MRLSDAKINLWSNNISLLTRCGEDEQGLLKELTQTMKNNRPSEDNCFICTLFISALFFSYVFAIDNFC